jgi:hypothetical protein
MSPNTILILQAIGVTVQFINAGIATAVHNPVVTLVIGGVAAGFSMLVQHLGNQTDPVTHETNSKLLRFFTPPKS